MRLFAFVGLAKANDETIFNRMSGFDIDTNRPILSRTCKLFKKEIINTSPRNLSYDFNSTANRVA